MSKMKKQKIYHINGWTSAGRYCNTPWNSSLKETIEFFIRTYPRFKGNAEIQSGLLEYKEDGSRIYGETIWNTFDTFSDINELKIYIIK